MGSANNMGVSNNGEPTGRVEISDSPILRFASPLYSSALEFRRPHTHITKVAQNPLVARNEQFDLRQDYEWCSSLENSPHLIWLDLALLR